MNTVCRKAKKNDIDAIYNLLYLYSEKGLMLSRTKDNILKYLGNFIVVENKDEIVACSAVRDFDNNLYEIRSLAVAENATGQGIGSKLVNFIIDDFNEKIKIYKLFALTYQEKFFYKLGFENIDKGKFPEKIWADCQFCKKKNCCDEIAVFIENTG